MFQHMVGGLMGVFGAGAIVLSVPFFHAGQNKEADCRFWTMFGGILVALGLALIACAYAAFR